MSSRPVRHLHKLMTVAQQPGGLKTMSDSELLVWIESRRAGLARPEKDKTGRSSKARRGWRESLDAAEVELAHRRAEND